MCTGRCPGCGETGPHKAILTHTATCEKYAALFREHPERALDPQAEHKRYLAEDRGAEKETALADRVARTQSARSAMAERFRTRDLLEE